MKYLLPLFVFLCAISSSYSVEVTENVRTTEPKGSKEKAAATTEAVEATTALAEGGASEESSSRDVATTVESIRPDAEMPPVPLEGHEPAVTNARDEYTTESPTSEGPSTEPSTTPVSAASRFSPLVAFSVLLALPLLI